MTYIQEKAVETAIHVLAFSTIAILALITVFIISQGLPFFLNHSVASLVFRQVWSPQEGMYGILAMIMGSLSVTIGALLVGIPLGVACAVCLVEFTSKPVQAILKPAIEILAGIPSVVYGFIGITVLVPFVRQYIGGSGQSVLAASLVLGIMILPTIISISMDALRAVPHSYKEGSVALGATDWQTTYRVLLPSARSGIVAGVILGMGRAIGETMAVIMIAGNAVQLPRTPLDSVRTMTANIALEMGYAIGVHRQALFATAIMLFLFILVLNSVAMVFIKRSMK